MSSGPFDLVYDNWHVSIYRSKDLFYPTPIHELQIIDAKINISFFFFFFFCDGGGVFVGTAHFLR